MQNSDITITKKQSNRDYYLKNTEKIVERRKKWILDNPLRARLSQKKASHKYQKSPRGIYSGVKGNARKRNFDFMGVNEFIEWYLKQKQECVYCGFKSTGRRLEIDRTDNNKGYVSGNLAIACGDCNGVKGNILTYEEMKIIGEVVMKKRWNKLP
jgi:hypothetical protein